MANAETLEAFYEHKFSWLPDNLKQDLSHVNVFQLEDHVGPGIAPVPYSRRDFYKIALVRGENLYHYANKSIRVNGPTLFFSTPWYLILSDCSGHGFN